MGGQSKQSSPPPFQGKVDAHQAQAHGQDAAALERELEVRRRRQDEREQRLDAQAAGISAALEEVVRQQAGLRAIADAQGRFSPQRGSPTSDGQASAHGDAPSVEESLVEPVDAASDARLGRVAVQEQQLRLRQLEAERLCDLYGEATRECSLKMAASERQLASKLAEVDAKPARVAADAGRPDEPQLRAVGCEHARGEAAERAAGEVGWRTLAQHDGAELLQCREKELDLLAEKHKTSEAAARVWENEMREQTSQRRKAIDQQAQALAERESRVAEAERQERERMVRHSGEFARKTKDLQEEKAVLQESEAKIRAMKRDADAVLQNSEASSLAAQQNADAVLRESETKAQAMQEQVDAERAAVNLFRDEVRRLDAVAQERKDETDRLHALARRQLEGISRREIELVGKFVFDCYNCGTLCPFTVFNTIFSCRRLRSRGSKAAIRPAESSKRPWRRDGSRCADEGRASILSCG